MDKIDEVAEKLLKQYRGEIDSNIKADLNHAIIKIEALGEKYGDLAHEIKNNLLPVSGSGMYGGYYPGYYYDPYYSHFINGRYVS